MPAREIADTEATEAAAQFDRVIRSIVNNIKNRGIEKLTGLIVPGFLRNWFFLDPQRYDRLQLNLVVFY